MNASHSPFARLPLRSKLIASGAVTAGVALALAALAQTVSLYLGALDDARGRALAVANVAAANSAAAVAFDDRTAGEQLLQALRKEPEILAARLLRRDGSVLAAIGAEPEQRPRSNAGAGVRFEPWIAAARRGATQSHRFEGLGALDVVRPIMLDGDEIGHLYVRSDLASLRQALALQFLILIGATALALLLAYALAVRFQRAVSEPLLHLVDVMKRVSATRDYRHRADVHVSDEIGALMHGFNDMLQQIEQRDAKLLAHGEQLESQVAERTRKLAETNASLLHAMDANVEARRHAEAASLAKSEFLARMSHEIRTPLNGVVGMTELLLNSTLDSRQQRFAATIRTSADSLLAIINDILDVSKIEAGKLKIDVHEFDLRAVVEDVAALFAQRAHEKGLDLLVDIEPALPRYVVGDQLRVRQVLLNLVSNAVKFTSYGHVLLRARGTPQSATQVALDFDVVDTGPGVRSESIERIFDAFTQEDGSTTRRYGGTGLGLTISRQLARLMGGSLTVFQADKPGAAFRFSLPLPMTHRSPTTVRERRVPAGLRIMIVDDNALNREILEAQLDAWGAKVVSANSASAALRVLTAMREADEMLDLLLVDWHMPEIDGVELVRRVRAAEAWRQLPVVLMSSVSDDLSSEAAEVLGIVSRLVKPIRQAELRAAIAAPTDCGADRATELAAAPSLESSVGRTPRRVLLAEDNPVNRMLATEMLALLGCDVTHAENGSEALAALERGGIEVVLMDCQMPVMDGLTATREWRAREAQRSNAAVRIVALTANALTGDRDECLLAGMNDFLAKPYTLAQLRGVLRIAPATAQASATAYSAREVLDVETLETVLALDPGGQGRLFTRLRAIYEKDAMRLVEDLAQAAAAQDFERVAARAHTLKSASANVGALRLAELAAAIETDARAGQGLPGGRTEHLRQELGLALDALRAYSPGRAA